MSCVYILNFNLSQIKKRIGDVNILVNNFGIINGKTFLDSSDSAIDKKFQINTLAHFWVNIMLLNVIFYGNISYISPFSFDFAT